MEDSLSVRVKSHSISHDSVVILLSEGRTLPDENFESNVATSYFIESRLVLDGSLEELSISDDAILLDGVRSSRGTSDGRQARVETMAWRVSRFVSIKGERQCIDG